MSVGGGTESNNDCLSNGERSGKRFFVIPSNSFDMPIALFFGIFLSCVGGSNLSAMRGSNGSLRYRTQVGFYGKFFFGDSKSGLRRFTTQG